MRRRDFVAGATAGVVTGVSGCLSGKITGSTEQPTEINVHLFQTDEITEQAPPATDSDYILD